jgi:FOG: FHA domain
LNDRPITFGRGSSCTVVLGDDYVSNQHARLTPAGDRWMLEDLGSTNGTYLSERRVTDATPVPLGAPIRLGRTTLELRG